MGNVVLLRKFPHSDAELGRFYILTRGGVIQNQRDLIFIKNLGQSRLIKFCNCHRGGDVVALYQIQTAFNELPGLHRL